MKTPSIRGIVPPVPTPLTSHGDIDDVAFHRIADHLVEGGINAAFVLGSTGECASLSMARKARAIEAAAVAFSGRVPVIVGVGDSCVDHSFEMAERAAANGAAAVVLNAPFYYDISSREMMRYLDFVLPRLPLPVLLYNMPWLTGHRFDDETILHAMDFPMLAGFKDSSGDLSYIENLISLAKARPELPVLIGSDFLLLQALQLGAHGAVAGGSNLYPQQFRILLDAHQRGDLDLASRLQKEIADRGNAIFDRTGNPSSVFAVIKGGMAALGLCEPFMVPPIEPCSAQLIKLLRDSLVSPAAA